MNYYNEFCPSAAAWLRELIKAGLIPNGYVDERSIVEVTAGDVEGFTQAHFFAGIGGWSYALQLAGVPATTKLWTGSPPCQPFSVAGKQLGQLDERHLAPTFMRLVDQCRPSVLFGEQVAAAIGKHWLDDLFIELERQDYACAAAVLPACSVGAPHKRDRLFFGAVGNAARISLDRSPDAGQSGRNEQSNDGGASSVADGNDDRQQSGAGRSGGGQSSRTRNDAGRRESISSMAHTDDSRPQGRGGMPECGIKLPVGPCGLADELADAPLCGRGEEREDTGRFDVGNSSEGRATGRISGSSDSTTDSYNGFWSDADWLGCRDGKFRPVESGTFPLANGVSARVGRLRGYGNAIVAQVAAEFIKAFYGAITDAGN